AQGRPAFARARLSVAPLRMRLPPPGSLRPACPRCAAVRPYHPGMNYLAHAWLARHGDDAILGALLGDFVHGQATLPDWPPVVRAEIVRHRRIDRYTDDHPAVVAARALFGGLRRYAGIVLDVYFDHRLARDWTRWNHALAGDVPLEDFTARVYRVLARHRDALPP